MKILHTADIHIRGKEELEILKVIMDKAGAEKCSAVLICGDMFDKDLSGLQAEQDVLPVLEKFNGEIFIIPGNHDADFLKKRKSLSSNSIVFNGTGYIKKDFKGIDLIAIPFQEGLTMKSLGNIPCDPDNSIVMAHGNFYTSAFFCDEDARNYFPIFEEDLADKFRYAALGHYHKMVKRQLGRTLAVNPGSPRITKDSDIGQRVVSILDTDTWKADMAVLSVPYITRECITVNMTDTGESILKKAETVLKKIGRNPLEKIILDLSGIMSDKVGSSELTEGIREIFERTSGKKCDVRTDGLRRVHEDLAAHPFVQSLLKELDQNSADSDEAVKERMKNFLLDRLSYLTE